MAIDQNINKIKFLRSKTAGLVPSPSLFDEGELAINLADRTIFSKNGTVVVELGFGKGGIVAGGINQTIGGITTSGTVKANQFEGPLVGNASTATKLQTARTINITGDGEASITFDGTSNQTLNLVNNAVSPLTPYTINEDVSPSAYKNGLTTVFVGVSGGGINNRFPLPYGGLFTAKPYPSNGGGTLQILTAYGKTAAVGGEQIKLRIGQNDGTWNSWWDLITSNNVGKFAPTLTGVGATGNWNINVEGYSTKLKTPVTINGTSFDGSSNITIADPTFAKFLSNIPMTDANLMGTAGVEFRFLPSSGLNKPIGDTDGVVMNMAYNNAWNFQLFGDHRTGVMHTRPKNNGTWGSWKTTLNNENIGDHALPISGGTLNGYLIVNGDIRSTGIIGSESTKGFGTGNNRVIKPVDLTARTFAVNFVGIGGLNSDTPGAIYGDFMTFNTWSGSSGGKLNGLFFAKGSQRIKHYQAAYDATVWGNPLDIAYLTDNVASATKLQTPRLINDVAFDGVSDIKTGLGFRGTIANAAQLDAAILDGKYAVTGYSIDGMYGCGILIVTTGPGVINQTYYAHNPAGSNSITQASRQTWNSVDWSSWHMLGSYDSTKLPLTGGTISGSLQVNGNVGVGGSLTVGNTIQSMYVYAKGAQHLTPVEQGAYMSWNKDDGLCRTDFINHRGGGAGGFDWWHGDQNGYTNIMALLPDNGGTLYVNKLEGTARSSDSVNTLGRRPALDTKDKFPRNKLSFAEIYDNGYPFQYGNVLNIEGGTAASQLAMQWGGAIPKMCMRSSSDMMANWSDWKEFAFLDSNVASATKLQTPRKINGVNFDATQDITVYDSTKLPLSGGTISGNLQINDGLIVRKDALVEGGVQGKTVRNRTGLDEKMYWIGAWNRPEQTNVVVTPVDANTISFRLTIQSGSQYIVNGSSQVHMLTGWDSGVNMKYIDPVIMSTTDVNAGMQVIDVIARLPNHGITAPTNYFWYALTYESYGCKIDKLSNHVGDTRFLVRLKCDEKFVMKSPMISATSTSNNWFSGTQSGTLGYPLQHSSYAVIIPVSVIEQQVVIFNAVENNTDAPASNCAYISIVVKDRIA